MLWIVFSVMTLVATAIIALPLVRRRERHVGRDAYSLEVYRHQLAELVSDVDRGVLTVGEEKSARLEIERRMLALSDTDPDEHAEAAAHINRWPEAGALALACAAGAFGIYLWLGSPEQPDQPFASRPKIDQVAQIGVVRQPGDMTAAIKSLSARLIDDPGDLSGWILLGQSYVSLQRYDDATDAYKRANALDPSDPDILLSLGESLVLGADGAVIPAANAAFNKALALDPSHIGARFYTAESLAQMGREREAFDIWLKIVGDTPADAPWLAALIQRLEVAADKLDIALAEVIPDPLPPISDAPGPGQADIAAAKDMSPEDRAAMIRSMVERLAARLEANPDDAEGWQRLAQAYQVLGEDDKARRAMARAEAAATPAATQAAPSTTAQAAPADLGPSQEDIVAARDMSAGDRSAMIRRMVDRLATRLKDEPDDFDGWMKLARSYGVLKASDKAQDAFRQALQVRPDDIDAMMQLASNLIEASDRDIPLPQEAVDLFERTLTIAPDNPDALFFTGMAAAQRNNLGPARAKWTALLKLLPPDSPAYATVKRRLDGLGE